MQAYPACKARTDQARSIRRQATLFALAPRPHLAALFAWASLPDLAVPARPPAPPTGASWNSAATFGSVRSRLLMQQAVGSRACPATAFWRATATQIRHFGLARTLAAPGFAAVVGATPPLTRARRVAIRRPTETRYGTTVVAAGPRARRRPWRLGFEHLGVQGAKPPAREVFYCWGNNPCAA